MKKVYVNIIEKISDNVTYGMAVINKTVLEHLPLVFSENQIKKLFQLAHENASKGGVNLFTRFGQYVVGIQIRGGGDFDGTINFIFYTRKAFGC